MNSALLTAALEYAAEGWHVFPLRPRDKIPLGGHAHKDATIDPTTIRAWWSVCPDANIGISLEASGLVVLDVDVGPGKGGFDALRDLNALHPLPATLTATTGGGGMHAVYSRPEGCPANRLIDFQSKVMPDAAKGSGLDLLGLGYIVAAPSIHPNGEPYVWRDSTPIAPLPDFLVRAYAARNKAVERPDDGDEFSVLEGGRDNALFRLGCSLRDTGLDEAALHVALYATNEKRCNPPLEDHEVARIVSSVMGRVVPTKDVLTDTAFIQSVLPDLVVHDPIKVEDGRLSVTLEQACAHEEPPKRVYSSGFAAIDEMTGGGYPTREATVVIAPPAAGKTAFAVATCLQMSIPSLYVSTELSTSDLRDRFAAQVLGVPWLDVMLRKVPLDVRNRALMGSTVRIVGSELLPHRSEDGSAATLHDKLRALALEIHAYSLDAGVPPFVVLDYMQDLARGMGDSTSSAVGEVSLILRNTAKALDCAIMVVAGTARGWYGAHPEIEHAEGFMAAGKESGGIEYDAAVTLFLDVDPDRSAGYQNARIAVAKSRQGVAGFVGARFKGAQGGRWEADPQALRAFSKEHRVDKKHSFQMEEDNRAVLLRVQNKGADPIGSLQHNCGIPATRAKRAIYRLLEDSRLEARKESRIDEHDRSKTHDVIGLPTSTQESVAQKLPEAVKNALPWLNE